MSSTLTENVVLVRTRSHDLNSVKKLNCWGCTLKDVSIVNRMPNLEVISLSINSIETLQYFSSCMGLQELYLRKNEIKDINEILYLSQLQFLKKLSLEDNPCTNVENYRLTVLKTLPNLEFLDNVRVTPEEIYQAEKLGCDLVWPGTETEVADEEIAELNNEYGTSISPTGEASPVHLDSHHSLNNGFSVAQPLEQINQAPQYEMNSNLGTVSSGSVAGMTINSTANRFSGSHLPAFTNGVARDNGSTLHSTKRPTNMTKSNSLSDYNIYSNGNYRSSSPTLSGPQYEPLECYEVQSNGQSHVNGNTMCSPSQQYLQSNSSSRPIANSACSQQRMLPKGGKNRNANILSAVLCLIKELDYGSLEVVDTTIHCRMEEMED